MSNNVNEVMNFDQLMNKYIKDKSQILSKYDYQTPLKEISPMEPLIFQNEILPTNNTNPNTKEIMSNSIIIIISKIMLTI